MDTGANMRALIIATGFQEGMDSLLSYRPAPLLTIADKPVIVHIIEALMQRNIKRFDVILSYLPQMVEEKLEEGRRWGVKIVCHLAKDSRYPFAVVRAIAHGWGDVPVVLANGTSLPNLEQPSLQGLAGPLIWMYPGASWSGWGIFPSPMFTALPANSTMKEFLSGTARSALKVDARPVFSVRSFAELKKYNLEFLAADHLSLLPPATGRMVEPGVWISRGVSIHPGARILAPVFIGENTRIQKNAVVGPGAVIENNCIIDCGSVVESSLILQKSYIGEFLELHNSIVDRNLLINLSLDTQVSIREDFILCELAPPTLFTPLLHLLERTGAFALFALFFPFYLYMSFTCRLKRQDVLFLPASEEENAWRSFVWLTFEAKPGGRLNCFQRQFERLPVLINIMRGEAHFVGVVPRKLEDAARLPHDWKKLYVCSKAGLIALSEMDNPSQEFPDQCYASEAYYAIHAGFKYDLKLILRWMKIKIAKLFNQYSSGL